MITPDTMPIFPKCPTFGFMSEPRYLVKIVARDGGFERRDRKWSRPLHRYTGVPMGDRPEEDIQELLYFWHAMGGSSRTFRFRDYADFMSCKTGETPTELDQPFVDLSGGQWQMVKTYTYGPYSQIREIRRPRGASIVIANELNDVQDPDNWTLDEATGIVEIHTGFEGEPTSWGGEFDVPARFDSEFPVEISNRKIQSLSIAIAEIRE